VRADLQSSQVKLDQFQDRVRADIRTENEKLLQRFEQQTQELRREFTSQMNAES
jgi:hypothetical protein